MTTTRKEKKIKCRYSLLGLTTLRRLQRHGTIVGYDNRNYPKVNWDGLSPKTVYVYDPKFIEIFK